jgi:iron complex outermembrane receptor protein
VKKIGLIGVFIFLTLFVSAQFRIQGIVLDSSTNLPLANVLIALDNDNSVVSDNNGVFAFNALEKGSKVLYLSHVGCDAKLIRINLQRDTTIQVYLAHHVHQFSQVVAYGHLHGAEPDARFKDVISQEKIQQRGAVTISDALSQTNGVNFLKTGPGISKPIINGMHSNRILVVNGETKQEEQQWGSEHAPEIDPLSAGQIEIIKGAGTLLYGGDGVGGVILLVPQKFKATDYKSVQLLAKGETNNSSGLVGLKFETHNANKQLGHRVTLNIKRAGDSRSPNYTLSNTAFGQVSGSYFAEKAINANTFQFTANAFTQKIGILQASHIGNLSDLNRALASDTPLISYPFTFDINRPYQFIQHYSSKLKWIRTFDKLGELEANYNFQHNKRQEFDNHNYNEKASLNLQLQTHQLYAIVAKHFKAYKWQYGVTGELQQNVFDGRYFIPNYRRYKAGVFSLLTLERDNYLIEGGLRYDAQTSETYRYIGSTLTTEQFNFSGISASLSGWKKWGEDFQFHLAAATKMRAPDINELFANGLHHGAAALEFGDLNLEQERSYSINTALHYNHNRLRIIAEPYFHLFNNYIYLQPSGETQLTIRGAFPVFRYVQTQAQYLGFDANISYWFTSHWSLTTNASLVYVKDLSKNEFIYGIPAQRIAAKIQYSTAQALGLKNANFSVKPSYTFKQNRLEAHQDFAPAPEGYFLLDAELDGSYGETPLSFLLSVNNILNKEYRDYMNRYRYFAAETGINISISLLYKF